jgi:urea transport system permease protein
MSILTALVDARAAHPRLTPLPLLLVGAALLFAAPLVLSDFRLALLAKFLAFAIVALGLDLIWGYTGLLSLGQGVFFGLGAYAMGMYLKLEAARSSLPDFMAWSGLSALPAYWEPFRHLWFALAVAVALPTVVGALLGYLVFRNRVQGVYFSIITQALALALSLLLIGQQPYTGGTNGLTNFSTLLGMPLAAPSTQRVLYFVTVACLCAAFALCWGITRSRFGSLLIAVRDDEQRLRFCGYDPALIKAFVFAVSAGLAGLAGALFAPQVGIVSPAMIGVVPSIEMVIWVAVGGRGTLVGAVVGALLVNAAKSGLSESAPTLWQYFLGALFIGVVLVFPDGIVGSLRRLVEWVRQGIPWSIGSTSGRATAPRGASRLASVVEETE